MEVKQSIVHIAILPAKIKSHCLAASLTIDDDSKNDNASTTNGFMILIFVCTKVISCLSEKNEPELRNAFSYAA